LAGHDQLRIPRSSPMQNVSGNLTALYMKKPIFSFVGFMLLTTLCLSQTTNETPPDTLDSLTKIYTVVEHEAKFPGNFEAWRKYLQKNLKINKPLKNGVPDGNYQVIITFMVTKEGKISDFNPETKFGYGMEDEVIRMLKNGPDWEPATRYGRKVNSIKTQRVTFMYAVK